MYSQNLLFYTSTVHLIILQGIYFADKFSKSVGYCRGPDRLPKFMFVCEVSVAYFVIIHDNTFNE